MAPGNAETVRRMYAAFHGGDLEAASAHFDADVAIDVRGRADSGSGRGIAYLLDAIGSWVDAFEEWHEEIEDIREVHGRVYVAAVQQGRGRETGIEVTQRYGLVYEVHAGRIVGMTMFPRAEDAAAEVGLSS